MYMSDVVPSALNHTSVHEVKLLMDIKSGVVDPEMIVAVKGKLGPETI
jgi:hypothetical protein